MNTHFVIFVTLGMKQMMSSLTMLTMITVLRAVSFWVLQATAMQMVSEKGR